MRTVGQANQRKVEKSAYLPLIFFRVWIRKIIASLREVFGTRESHPRESHPRESHPRESHPRAGNELIRARDSRVSHVALSFMPSIIFHLASMTDVHQAPLSPCMIRVCRM